MNEPRSESQHELDPERLERGLQQLRQLGYLQAPAAEYVARRVGARGSLGRIALLAGFWVGAPAGLLFALFLSLGAVASDPDLLSGRILWLWLDLSVALSAISMIVTGGYAALLVFVSRRYGRFGGTWRDEIATAIPGIMAGLYLADRIGTTWLANLPGGSWWVGAVAVLVVAGLTAGLVGGLLAAGIALAKVQAQPGRTWTARSSVGRYSPVFLTVVLVVALLARGPYRPVDRLPYLDEIEVSAVAEPQKVVLVAFDAGEVPGILEGDGSVALATRSGLHPIAYWNELATGFPASEHGLLSAATEGPRGWSEGPRAVGRDPLLGLVVRHLLPGVGLARRHATDIRELRRPQVWEILARGGRRARIINWWGTYPATEVEGLEVVTERHFLRAWSGQLDTGDAHWPASAGSLDSTSWQELTTAAATRSAKFEAPLLDRDSPGLLELWTLATTSDLYHMQLAGETMGAGGPDLVAVTLNGGDILTRGMQRLGMEEGVLFILHAYRDYLRALVAEFAPAFPQDTVWLEVVTTSDGMRSGRCVATEAMPRMAIGWGSWLLEKAGVPPAVDMVGIASASPSAPDTYGRARRTAIQEDRSADDLERLESLGYIGN